MKLVLNKAERWILVKRLINLRIREMWGIILLLKTPLCFFSGLWLVDLYTSKDCRVARY